MNTKKMLVGFLIVGLLFAANVGIVSAQFDDGADVAPDGNGLMQRFMNRVRDMLGVCQGGVNLSELSGLLTFDGTNYFIGDVELHFGPVWYITTSDSAIDYDGDGSLELISDELQGLVGSEVTVEGHYQSDNWISVFTINGELYREVGQPIWASQHQWRWRNNGNGNGPN